MMIEAHIIAWKYHWNADFIKNLPIRERKEWCNLIKSQIKAENDAAKPKKR